MWEDIPRRISTELNFSLATESSVTATINFPPPARLPRIARVGLLESNVNSLSILVIFLRSPSTSMMTTRIPSISAISSPPPLVRSLTISASNDSICLRWSFHSFKNRFAVTANSSIGTWKISDVFRKISS